MEMLRACSHDSIGFIECNDFSSHSFISVLLFAVTASPTATTVVADIPWNFATSLALCSIVVFDECQRFLLFLKPPKRTFFFGCVMWMTFIASRAKP